MLLRHLLRMARHRRFAILVLALGLVGVVPPPAPRAVADPAVAADLARELEGEMLSDRAAELALWAQISDEWRRLSERTWRASAAAREGFAALEDPADRESAHGTIPKMQTRWLERFQRGLTGTRAEAR